MAETQMLPEPGTKLEKVFLDMNLATTALFSMELLLNIFAHSANRFYEFVNKQINWFDVFVVAASLLNAILSATGNTIPGAKVFRVLRLCRVLRVFTAFKDLQKLVSAVSAAIIPVLNAFIMLLIIVSVYAVLGTNFFRTRSPEYFGQFSVSLYTMFQILAEGIAISREIFQEGKTESGVAVYFVSYILIVAVGLLNVTVAVLLEAFQRHIRATNEKMEQAILIEEEKRKIHGCLDPLTKGLLTFEDEADLTCRIDEIYSKLDEDESGGLAFEEFREGVKWLSKSIHLTRDDFDVVTENGKHLGETAEFNRQQFQMMMKGELWRYSRRELANVLSVSGDEEFNSTILMLKIMESRNDAALAEVLRLLRSNAEHIQLLAGPPPPNPPSSFTGRASLGTGGGEQGGGLGGGVEGLGELLHKLSSNMQHMSSKMEQMSATVYRQSSNMEHMSSRIEQMSDKIDRQSSNMEQMSSKMDRHSAVLVLVDQMAATMRMQATNSSSPAPRAASPLPRKFEHKGGRGWVGENETDPVIGQQLHAFLAAPSSTLLEQISDGVTPSHKRQQILNDKVLLQNYPKGERASQGRGGRNEGRKEGGDRLSSPSLPRYMEHVHLVDKVRVADDPFAPVSRATALQVSLSCSSPPAAETAAAACTSLCLEEEELLSVPGRPLQEGTLQCDAEARHIEAHLRARREPSSACLEQVENEYASRTDERIQRLEGLLSDRVTPYPTTRQRTNDLVLLQSYEKSTRASQGRRGRTGDRMEGEDLLSDPSTRDMEHVASNKHKTAEDMIEVAQFHLERRMSFVEACYYSEPADSTLDRKRAEENHMMQIVWSKDSDSNPTVAKVTNMKTAQRRLVRESEADSGSRPVGGRKGRADGAGGVG